MADLNGYKCRTAYGVLVKVYPCNTGQRMLTHLLATFLSLSDLPVDCQAFIVNSLFPQFFLSLLSYSLENNGIIMGVNGTKSHAASL